MKQPPRKLDRCRGPLRGCPLCMYCVYFFTHETDPYFKQSSSQLLIAGNNVVGCAEGQRAGRPVNVKE